MKSRRPRILNTNTRPEHAQAIDTEIDCLSMLLEMCPAKCDEDAPCCGCCESVKAAIQKLRQAKGQLTEQGFPP